MIINILLGSLTGLHVACYGAYKDSPYEQFKMYRFLREIVLAVVTAISLSFIPLFQNTSLTIRFLIIMAFSRIITEIYKQFFRIEPQDHYKIPSMVHVWGKIPRSWGPRLGLCGFVILILVLATWGSNFIYTIIPIHISGLFIGFIGGIVTAFGGGYKDGFFEGFSARKFFRSPVIAVLSGYIISYGTPVPAFILFGSMGLERMIVEFYKGFLKANYVPGKFKDHEAKYPIYFDSRKRLITPYAMTWLVLVFLLTKDKFLL